jgi:hypothetical protein
VTLHGGIELTNDGVETCKSKPKTIPIMQKRELSTLEVKKQDTFFEN